MKDSYFTRRIYDSLPESLKAFARFIKARITGSYKKENWITNIYEEFAISQRKHLFLSIARFSYINRPITGYYFEFGCHEANTMRLAWDNFRWLFDWKYVAFDSFEGLPEIPEIDQMEIWQKGKLCTTEESFKQTMRKYGMPDNRLVTVKGFYNESLTQKLKDELLPSKAAVVYIDCDLYSSTVPVLDFIKDFLQIGTIIVFDDWNCFYGDPSKGERKAFREFCSKNPELIFEEFVSTNEAMSFVFIGVRANDDVHEEK